MFPNIINPDINDKIPNDVSIDIYFDNNLSPYCVSGGVYNISYITKVVFIIILMMILLLISKV